VAPEVLLAGKRQQRKERISAIVENIYQPVELDVPNAIRSAYRVANNFSDGPLDAENLRVWRGLLSLNPGEVSDEVQASLEMIYEMAESNKRGIQIEELEAVIEEHAGKIKIDSRLDILMTIFVLWDTQVLTVLWCGVCLCGFLRRVCLGVSGDTGV